MTLIGLLIIKITIKKVHKEDKGMQHIINVAFDFDDEKVKASIENQVHKEVIDNITNEIKQNMYRKKWGGCGYDKDNPEPLKNMIEKNVKDILEDHKEMIIEIAANKLADSLKRSKAVKETVGHVLNEANL